MFGSAARRWMRRGGSSFAGLVLWGCQSQAAGDHCSIPCGAQAVCDAVIDACFCEPGAMGDPVVGCMPHGDLCAEAEVREGHSVCRHEIEDAQTWTLLSIGHGKEAGKRRAVKYLVPAGPDARLPTVFGDTNWYRSHHCLLAAGFEPLFPNLSYGGYRDLVIGRQTREYYGGTISELSTEGPQGERFVFTVETYPLPEELLQPEEIYEVYRQLGDRFGLGHGALAYTTTSEVHQQQAEGWDDPPFPVLLLPEGTGPQYEAYTTGLAYGRVRRLTNEQLAAADGAAPAFGWQDILVLDEPPLTLEGVMAAAVTEARQDVLTHLNVLSSLRGTPNVKVDGARDEFAPYEGQLVRLDVRPDYYSIQPASLQEAQVFWAEHRPRAELGAPPDFSFTALVDLDEIPTGSSQARTEAVSRFGAKAAGLAVLRSVGDGDHIVRGFGIPMGAYDAFVRGNAWEAPGAGTMTYAETIERWLDDDEFRSDATLRAERLAALRTEMIERGVVDPALVDAVREQIGAVFGDPAVMVRFRSSSNAEDSLSFNGAGLYDSVSGCGPDAAGDPASACDPSRGSKPVDEALRRVWASLWSFGAFEEREYYQLDHRQVGMGLLVNPRFALEQANGVVFTGNPGDLQDPRLTINVQLGEVPVVGATPGVVAELNRVRVEGGMVTSIDREIASSLVPEGSHVLDDDRLGELATLVAEVAASYPVDEEPPPGSAVMLDLEFKLTADGQLVLEQVRPFAAQPYVPGDGACG